jgi:hypothetical protein
MTLAKASDFLTSLAVYSLDMRPEEMPGPNSRRPTLGESESGGFGIEDVSVFLCTKYIGIILICQ